MQTVGVSTNNPFFNDASDIADRVVWKNFNRKSWCSVGKVTAINANPVSVNLQPMVQYYDQTARWNPYPILNNVPVAQLQTSAAQVLSPLNVGDTGIIIWFDREAYTTLSGTMSTPNIPDSGNMFDQNACVFLPFLTSFSLANQLQNSGYDVLSNQISLLTQLLNELTTLSSFMTSMSTFLTALTNPALSFPDINTAASAFLVNLPSIQTQLTEQNTNLTTFKGNQP